MAYLHTDYTTNEQYYGSDITFVADMPDVSRTFVLTEEDRDAVLAFLDKRPVHTVAMTSFIYDNGIDSPLNRGKFYGYHDRFGNLEGVALIGHTTLVEARTKEALQALAFASVNARADVHVIVSGGDDALDFWANSAPFGSKPRSVCREYLFEIGFPFPVKKCDHEVRLARPEELEQIAEAQAETAFLESGVDPLANDREGFLSRVLRRIEQGRIYVAFDGSRLVFKADVVSLTTETAYLEGIYVAKEHRQKGIGSSCLAEVGQRLLNLVPNVCLFSNTEFKNAHRTYINAGFRKSDICTAVFV